MNTNIPAENRCYDLAAISNKGKNYENANVINGFVINANNELEHYIDREGVTKAVIPDGIKKIPRHVFYECRFLKSLFIPNSVEEFRIDLMHCNNFEEFIVNDDHYYFTVMDGVLYDKYMTKLIYCPNGLSTEVFVVPEGVRDIDDDAFSECHKIKEIILPESVEFLGYDAFSCCSSLKKIRMPRHLSDCITENTFFGCSELEEITIPDGVRSIGANVFDGCESLKKITFGKTMMTPQDFSLGLPALEEIIVDPENPYLMSEDGFLYNKTKTILLAYAGGRKGEVTIPEGVTQIGLNSLSPGFAYCDKITSIKVPGSVKRVYAGAFEECSADVIFAVPDKIEYFTENEHLP